MEGPVDRGAPGAHRPCITHPFAIVRAVTSAAVELKKEEQPVTLTGPRRTEAPISSLVYNSGRFRMAGIGSNAGTLPLGDANAIVMDMGLREILPAVPDTPVIAGVNGTDPTRHMGRLLEQVRDAGFAGVINFPNDGHH